MFDAGIFYCPKNFEEISFYGNFYSEEYNMLQIAVVKYDVEGSDEFFEKLNLVVLVNDKIIAYEEDQVSPVLKSFSDFYSFPIHPASPIRTQIPIQRSWFRPYMAPSIRMFGYEPESENYISIPSGEID